MSRVILEDIITDFSPEKFTRFFRDKSAKFAPKQESFSQYNDENFKDSIKLGEIKFVEAEQLAVFAFRASQSLSERSGKKSQYEKGKKILKERQYDAGIFIFYDDKGNFRFSLIYANYLGRRRDWSLFRRFTYFVSQEFTNKTFLQRIGNGDFSNLEKIKEAFSIAAVTDLFYNEFFEVYDKAVKETQKINKIENEEKARDFVLLFSIRTVFLGFIQKKKWIGKDEKFIQNYLKEYKNISLSKSNFYSGWLAPLFFEALNSPQGRKVAYGNNDFSPETETNLQMAPYLNGGLFKSKRGYDDNGWVIPDKEIEEFFDFLFAHSFTIEENSLDDEDLQLNPEFLGIIFERLVNKADGAVYTPRTEVDLMCRLSLVKWLQKNLVNPIKIENLYELFFRESKNEEDQKQGSFSQKEVEEILEKLENLTICDPAVGSGAFLVGMMQVLDEIEQVLKKNYVLNDKNLFERKKQIIKNSLYGVEVKEWAVWICQLRLWLSLFVDAPDGLKDSVEPILPSLDFKVRQGDSLVQLVGSKAFPISGHNLSLTKSIKGKITNLKNLKFQYFDNRSDLKDWELRRAELVIYEEIIDIEIKEKADELRTLRNLEEDKTISLFGDKNELEQVGLEFDKDKIVKLESEILEFKEQKKTLLMGGKPFVWSIEFAEVFVEKGGFDLIIGNPPYVRQEKIEDPTGKIRDKKEYKNCLEEMVKLDFPEDFSKKTKINAQSDLYAYFYIRGLRLLNPQGVHTFICSNSWLDVGYGVWLQDFLLKRCPVDLIIDNHVKRSFEAADVNTIISIIHAPQNKIDENHLVKFVAFKKPFEEAIFTENLLAIENAKEVESSDIFRVYPIATKDLQEAGTEYEENTLTQKGKYVGDKWGGKYLRAPDIFFTILEKGKDKLVPLKEVADIRFGIKTGANEFFYLTGEQAKQWGIEEEFLKPVIKSPQECQTIFIDARSLPTRIIICPKSKEELSSTKILNYINWGEKQKTKGRQKQEAGIKLSEVESVQGRSNWYSIELKSYPDFFCNRFFNERFFFSYSQNIVEDQTFYGATLISKKNKLSQIALLNSSLQVLFIELYGRVGLGEGVMQYAVYEMQKLLVLNVQSFSNEAIKFIDNALQKIKSRKINNIFQECGLDPRSKISIGEQEPKPLLDRAELDKIVFDSLGLTEDERKEVYRAVCRLVWNRVSKAKSV